MGDFGRLLALLALGGAALTGLGAFCVWFLDEGRRVRASLKKVLRAKPSAQLVAKGRGAGAAIDLAAGTVGVCWDAGGWCLSYRLDELMGAEVIVDGVVAARVHRGEARRPLDRLVGAEELVRLRLLFDDASYPDFELDLWTPDDDGRRDRLNPDAAVQEANRWLARVDSIFRRPAPRTAPAVAAPALDPLGDADDAEEAYT